MELFSKRKDYNNLLENILDRKTFSSATKSLLLSMIYKIEIAYRDYTKVKVNSLSKDAFLSHLLEVIRNYCEHIKTVEPDSPDATLLEKYQVEAVTNGKERSILAYPTEIALLYAISDIEEKYFFIKESFIGKEVFQKLLVEGYKQNTLEVLKNFNGWSWDVNVNEKKNDVTNLVYQNLLMIKGEKFLYDWRLDASAQKDYLLDLKRSVKKVTGNDNYYLSLCKLLYLIADPKDKKKIKKQLEEKKRAYQQLLSEPEEIKKQNATELKKLKNYCDILNNPCSEYEELVNLQTYFLVYLKKRIEKVQEREEMLAILYQIRYYQNINFFNGVLIKDYQELKESLDYVWKLAITKACKMNILKIISMDIETNFELIKYILDTHMIDLEEIRIYVALEKGTIFIKVYDKEVFEKQGKIQWKGNPKDIVMRKRKVVKLFN